MSCEKIPVAAKANFLQAKKNGGTSSLRRDVAVGYLAPQGSFLDGGRPSPKVSKWRCQAKTAGRNSS
jgi:hypothetical protein